MATKIVVIGAGPGGYQAAIRAAQLGGEVTVVESAGVGGTCLHWGCIPTKTLKASADAMKTAGRLAEFGIKSEGGFTVDMAALMARKEKVIAPQAKGIESLFKAYGIELLRGRGKLTAPNEVNVALNEGGEQSLTADRVILATGSSPADLPGLARDGKVIINSDDALNLTELPERLAVVGGGVVGSEFAFIMSALGCQVTLIEALDRLLPIPSLDTECSKLLMREMKKARIKAHLGMVVEELDHQEGGVKLKLGPSPLIDHGKRPPKAQELVVDKVLVSVGRKLNLENLGLEDFDLARGDRGLITVNEHMATSLEGLFAIGDMLGPSRPMLAHMASAEGHVAAANCLGLKERVSYNVVPAVAFTSPEVAWVGLSPEQAREAGAEILESSFAFRVLGKAQAMGEISGQCKLVSEAGSGKLLGAHIIGPHAGDLIHECALALNLGANVSDLAHTIHAHPTLSEAVLESAESALGLCVHAPPKK